MQSDGVYFTPFRPTYGIRKTRCSRCRYNFMPTPSVPTVVVGLRRRLHLYTGESVSYLSGKRNYNVTLWISNGVCTLFYDPIPFNFGEPDTTPVDVGIRASW